MRSPEAKEDLISRCDEIKYIKVRQDKTSETKSLLLFGIDKMKQAVLR